MTRPLEPPGRPGGGRSGWRGDQSRPGTAGALVETGGLWRKGRRGPRGGGHGQRGQPLDLGTPAENGDPQLAHGGLHTLMSLEGRGCSVERDRAGERSPAPRPLGLSPGRARSQSRRRKEIIAFVQEHQIPRSCTQAAPGPRRPRQHPDSSAWRAKGSGPPAGGAFPGQRPPPHPRRAAPLSVPRTRPSCGTARG